MVSYHAIRLATRLSGETPATLKKAFGMSNYSIVSSVVSRTKNEAPVPLSLRRRVEHVERQLEMSQDDPFTLFMTPLPLCLLNPTSSARDHGPAVFVVIRNDIMDPYPVLA